MSRTTRSFAGLDELAAALEESVGCDGRRDGVGGAYTDQGLACRTRSGRYVVALLGLSPQAVDRFVADRAGDDVSTPREHVVVRGDGWLVNAGDRAVAGDLVSALGGELVVIPPYERDAAAAAAAAAAYQAKLPRPQRPDLTPEQYPAPPRDRSQTLVVHLGPPRGDEGLAAMDIDDALAEAIEAAGLGVSDGDGHGPEGTDFFYSGPDAEAMLAAVRPVLAQLVVPPGSHVELHDASALVRTEDLPPSDG